MRAIVTGGGGFIGRHLVHRLIASGVDVRAMARSRELGYAPRELESGLIATFGRS